MDVVEPAGECFADMHEFCRDELEALAFEASYDFAREVPLDGVRLNDD